MEFIGGSGKVDEVSAAKPTTVDEPLEYVETEWVEMKTDDDECDNFNGMFAEPCPMETFKHSFLRDGTHPIELTLLGHHAENGQQLNSTGLTLWRAAPLLCDYMVGNSSELIIDKNVLELGAGLGLCGILAGALGARRVVITDGDTESLEGMRVNVSRNMGVFAQGVVSCKQLRWGLALDAFSRHCKATGCEVCRTADHVCASIHSSEKASSQYRFDTIIGSDIIYTEGILDPLFTTVNYFLTAGGCFVLAYARRNVKIDLVLHTANKHGFEWTSPASAEGCFVFTRCTDVAK